MATAAGNILLTLQTKAKEGGFTDLLSFGAIVSKVAAKVTALTNATFDYTRASKVLAGSITEADVVTKGTIDTTELMASRNKLAAAGIELTADEFAKLNKFAAATAQTMGKEVEPAVRRFMDSLTSGRTTALKAFGIELKESGSVSETFSGVMEQVTERVDGMNVKIRDSKERLFIMENNLGTAAGEISNFAGDFTALNIVMDTANELLSDFIKSLQDLERAGGSFGGFLFSAVEDIVGTLAPDSDLAKTLARVGAQGRLADSKAKGKELAARREREAARTTAKKPRGKGKKKKVGSDTLELTLEDLELIDLESQLTVGGLDQELIDQIERRFGSDIAIRAATEGFLIGIEEASKARAQAQEDLIGRGVGEGALGDLGISDLIEQTKEEKFVESIDKQKLEQEEEFNLTLTHKDELFQLELDAVQRERQLDDERKAFLLANDEEFRAEQAKLDRAARQQNLQGTAQMFGDLSALMEVENRKAFAIGKSMAISQALIQSFVSAENAWARGMEIPFVGFVLAPIFAAASVISSAVRIAKISSMQFKGGGSSAGAGGASLSAGSVSTPSAGSLLGGGAAGAGQREPQIINVRLDSDLLLGAMINAGRERDRAGAETIEIKQSA